MYSRDIGRCNSREGGGAPRLGALVREGGGREGWRNTRQWAPAVCKRRAYGDGGGHCAQLMGNTWYGTASSVIKTEGALGLYRGVAPTLIGAFPYEGIKVRAAARASWERPGAWSSMGTRAARSASPCPASDRAPSCSLLRRSLRPPRPAPRRSSLRTTDSSACSRTATVSAPPPPPLPRTNRTRLVPSSRTNRTRPVPPGGRDPPPARPAGGALRRQGCVCRRAAREVDARGHRLRTKAAHKGLPAGGGAACEAALTRAAAAAARADGTQRLEWKLVAGASAATVAHVLTYPMDTVSAHPGPTAPASAPGVCPQRGGKEGGRRARGAESQRRARPGAAPHAVAGRGRDGERLQRGRGLRRADGAQGGLEEPVRSRPPRPFFVRSTSLPRPGARLPRAS